MNLSNEAKIVNVMIAIKVIMGLGLFIIAYMICVVMIFVVQDLVYVEFWLWELEDFPDCFFTVFFFDLQDQCFL